MSIDITCLQQDSPNEIFIGASVLTQSGHLGLLILPVCNRIHQTKFYLYLQNLNNYAMSSKYKIGEDAVPHFVTFTVVGWIDVFSREIYKELLIQSIKYCQENKGMILHAWVIMTNHIHLIMSSRSNKLEYIVRDFKKFTSKKIVNLIVENNTESRKEWLLNIFKFAGSGNNNNKEYQFWKQDYHPVQLNTLEKLKQRLDYLHNNPVRSGLVWEPFHFKYSSAIDYYTKDNGLLKIEHL